MVSHLYKYRFARLQAGIVVAWILLTGSVFYISWLPLPQLGGQVVMPEFIAVWVDAAANINLRTAVPFLLLGLVAGVGLSARDARWCKWLLQGSIMVAIAAAAEIGQLWIPARTCDAGDILWAAAGAAAGLVVAWLTGKVIRAAGCVRRRAVKL
jgi:VanZ family protein